MILHALSSCKGCMLIMRFPVSWFYSDLKEGNLDKLANDKSMKRPLEKNTSETMHWAFQDKINRREIGVPKGSNPLICWTAQSLDPLVGAEEGSPGFPALDAYSDAHSAYSDSRWTSTIFNCMFKTGKHQPPSCNKPHFALLWAKQCVETIENGSPRALFR